MSTYELTDLKQFESSITAVNMSSLSPEKKQQIYELAKELNVESRESITTYGSNVLQEIAQLSTSVLNRTSNQQLSTEIADTLKSTMTTMRNVSKKNKPARKGLMGMIDKWQSKAADKLFEIQLDNQNVNQALNVMEGRLQVYIEDLERDAKVLDELKSKNANYYEQLGMYIAASQLKLKEFETIILPQRKLEAEKDGDMMKIQEYNELASMKTQLERHIYNLESAKQSTFQQSLQIAALREADEDQKQQLRDHILLSVPLWRSQLGLTSMIGVQSEIAGISKASSDFTNELMKTNAKLLRTTMIDISKQSERGIVDAESFEVVTKELESMLTDIMTEQENGRRKRKEAEVIWQSNEKRLKQAVMTAGSQALRLNERSSNIIDGEFK